MSTGGPTPKFSDFSSEQQKHFFDIIQKISTRQISMQSLPAMLGEDLGRFKVFYNLVRQRSELEKKRDLLQAQREALQEKGQALQAELKAREESIAQNKKEIQELETKREGLGHRIETLATKTNALSDDIASDQQKIEMLVKRKAQLEAEKARHHSNIEAARRQAEREITKTTTRPRR